MKKPMNADKLRLKQQIDRLPDSLLQQVFDFVDFFTVEAKGKYSNFGVF